MNWAAPRRVGLYAVLVALYLVSTVPVGLFLYSLKTEVGLDIFRHGGFHAYMQCLRTSFPLGDNAATQAPLAASMLSGKHQACTTPCQPM